MMLHDRWPALPYEAWKDTYETLHLWLQIVGKIRLTQMPWLNHCWHVTLYPSARGLTTGRMPYGGEHLQIDFDFVAHELRLQTSRGELRRIGLAPMSVADFYRALMAMLDAVSMPVRIHAKPCEVESPVPFDHDVAHGAYVHRWWLVLSSAADVFMRFRARFYGKASPVHFFWGAFDLAVTRFSGR